jgi:spermidine synthase
VFLCAACGLVYELALITLGPVPRRRVGLPDLPGARASSSARWGSGSFASKPLLPRAAAGFAAVELHLALAGGLSVLGLYAAYAWLDLYTPALHRTSVVVGGLIGAEIPLLMALLQRIRRRTPARRRPTCSPSTTSGRSPAAWPSRSCCCRSSGRCAGRSSSRRSTSAPRWSSSCCCATRCRPRPPGRRRRACWPSRSRSGSPGRRRDVPRHRRQALYDDPVVVGVRSDYQEIVLTEARETDDVRLFLDGDLQFASGDEHRYHEALVHPAVVPGARSVLVLGGGDGLAAREVLRHDAVERVVEVELDPAVLELARTDPRMVAANDGALDDPAVEVVVADAMSWLRTADEVFDAVVVDLPDPDAPATAKLYSQEFYGLTARVLAPGGRLVVQAGSPYFAPEAFWCIDATVAATGLATTTYHVDVPSFGDWGFVLAARGAAPVPSVDPAVAPELRFLDGDVLAAATVFPRDRGRARYDVEVSTLDRPAHPRVRGPRLARATDARARRRLRAS